MLLFRRLRRGRDEPEPEPTEPAPEAEIVPTPVEETSPEPSPPLSPEPPLSPPDPARPVPAATSGPPPLPERTVVTPAHPGAERGPFASCFVCGGPLDAGFCPTCRMSWLE